MKHPLFESLGDSYPSHLEKQYDRVLTRIEKLWGKPEVSDYFSELLMDTRGGRKGFPNEVMKEIMMLRELSDQETLRKAEKNEDAILELERRGVGLKKETFFLALRNGDRELVDLFVRSNFNIHRADESGNEPLMYALKLGHTVVAKILLDAGADVNARDRLGLTPLLVACGNTTRGYKTIAEALIKKGAQINVRDSLGFTPLLLSLSGGILDIARLLIERGADVSVCTKKGETALTLAKSAPDPESAEIVELLLRKGAKH
ncbi:MAG: ankyrin repeat domain-containing protein [Rhodocyclaceae bacterium]|nr:ankyrin repeat domain-containing protein [Rhodocyclaceae bacterium]